MKLHRLDDYQSWLIEASGRRIGVDPWLTAEHALPGGHWLFGRRREAAPACGVEPMKTLDALIITGPFADHCDPDTLAHVKRDLPCFAQKHGAHRLRKLGFTNVTVMKHGDRVDVVDSDVSLEAIAPNFPYHGNSMGFVLSADGSRLGFETHGIDLEQHATRLSSLDCLVMPVQGVRLLGIPFVASPERALTVAQRLTPKAIVPTGNDPQKGHGLLDTLFLSYKGTVEGFGEQLRAALPGTNWAPLKPGESLPV